jgi:hypothetical protein
MNNTSRSDDGVGLAKCYVELSVANHRNAG